MLTINAEKREVFGKRLKNSRKEGKLPVVVYGPNKKESSSYFVDTVNFKKIWEEAGESTIINLNNPEGDTDVLIHEVSFHPVSGEPLHVDLYALDTNKSVTVSIPIEFEGVAPAVKNLGGILVKVMHELEISVLPKELPQEIVVNLSSLEGFDDQIQAKDLPLPPSAKLEVSEEEVVASIAQPKEEEEEEVVAPDLSAIEVEKKGKAEETGEEGAETKS